MSQVPIRNAVLTLSSLFLVVLLLLPFVPVNVQAYNQHQGETHQWLLQKSLDYLKGERPDIAARFPLDLYLTSLQAGVTYADMPEGADGSVLICKWDYPLGSKEYPCDTLHHYLHGDVIESEFGVDVGHPGEITAPSYAQVLFDQALKFWPGGSQPSLEDLPLKDGGYLALGGEKDLGLTDVGGTPFCLRLHADYKKCPMWPPWASLDVSGKQTKEGADAALQYLGWSIHLVQDLTVPYHARNDATEAHQQYEDRIDQWIKAGIFDHLPLAHPGAYKYGSTPVVPRYFRINDELYDPQEFTVTYLANEAGKYGGKGKLILNTGSTYFRSKELVEPKLDAAIKLVAAELESFFDKVTPMPVESDAWSDWRQLGDLPGGAQKLFATRNDYESGVIYVIAIASNGRLILNNQVEANGGWSSAWKWIFGLPSEQGKAVAIARHPTGIPVLFAIGGDNGIWTTRPVGPQSSWYPPERLYENPNEQAKEVVATINRDGGFEIFAVGTDDRIYGTWETSYYDAPDFDDLWSHQWKRIGTEYDKGSNLAVGTNQDGRLELFTIGLDSQVWHTWQEQPGSGWDIPWEQLPTNDFSAERLVVGKNADGRLEVFTIDHNGAVWHLWQTAPNSDWTGTWQRLGDVSAAADRLAVAANADGRLEVFIIATDGFVYHTWQQTRNSAFLNTWERLGGSGNEGKELAVAENKDGRLEVFVIGLDDQVWHAWQIERLN